MTIKFETGKTYTVRSIGDSECIYRFKILKRTEKSVWIEEHGEKTVRRTVTVRDGVEAIKPYGTYSMSPTLMADKVAV